MWIITKDGFYSAVEADDGRICVRTRARKDLDHLRRLIPELTSTVETRTGRDYRYRAFCSHAELAAGLATAALEIDYPNFKSEVERHDKKRARFYSRVWSVLGDIQPGGPYGWRLGRKRPGQRELIDEPFDLPLR